MLIKEIMNTIIFYENKEVEIQEALLKYFNISHIEYEIEGINKVFEGIVEDIKSKKEKIAQLEETRYRLQNEVKTKKHKSNILEEKNTPS